jgi:copper chaperone CopZ
MSCGHCLAAITAEVTAVAGVDSVDVDLDTKLVRISGEGLDDPALVSAIGEAGYEAVRVRAPGERPLNRASAAGYGPAVVPDERGS